jgi:hypothetical protein
MSSLDFDLRSVTREEHFPHLTPEEWDALMRMADNVGDTSVKLILRGGNEAAQSATAQEYMARELASTRAFQRSTPASNGDLKPQIIKLDVTKYVGDERVPLRRWFTEVDVAIKARRIADEPSLFCNVMFGWQSKGMGI